MDTSNQRQTWVMRAGVNGEAKSLFLKSAVIALNEPGLGDLRALKADRLAFYEAYRRCDPNNTNTGISGIGGKFFRFVHEVKLNDMILFPSLMDKQVYFGCVTSEYFYAPNIDNKFPHQRKVQWDISFKKSELSVWAKRELGAARTFFEFKRNIEEVLNLIENGPVKKIPSA
jgi:restriction system protein